MLNAILTLNAEMEKFVVSALIQVMLIFFKRLADIFLDTTLLTKFVESKEASEPPSTANKELVEVSLTGTCMLVLELEAATKRVPLNSAVVALTGKKKDFQLDHSQRPRSAETRIKTGTKTSSLASNGSRRDAPLLIPIHSMT